MSDISVLLAALAVVAVVLLAPRLRGGFGTGRKGRRHRGIDVEADLLRACGGDKAIMERLIDYESNRKPDLSRRGAALLALSRLRSDRR